MAAQYHTVHLLTPVGNLFIHAQWGRGQETWGEDSVSVGRIHCRIYRCASVDADELRSTSPPPPYVNTSLPTIWIRRFRSMEPTTTYASTSGQTSVKLICIKHTYRHLKPCRNALGVMVSYNAINGVPMCVGPYTNDILRGEWGFSGYATSDGSRIEQVYTEYRYTKSLEETAAQALLSGLDQDIGTTYTGYIRQALMDHFITEADIDRAVNQSLTSRFLTGQFDPPASVPYNTLSQNDIDTSASRLLARRSRARIYCFAEERWRLLAAATRSTQANWRRRAKCKPNPRADRQL